MASALQPPPDTCFPHSNLPLMDMKVHLRINQEFFKNKRIVLFLLIFSFFCMFVSSHSPSTELCTQGPTQILRLKLCTCIYICLLVSSCVTIIKYTYLNTSSAQLSHQHSHYSLHRYIPLGTNDLFCKEHKKPWNMKQQ